MITSYQKYQNTIKSLANKPRLLLHSCCAPCSSHCLEELSKYFQIDIFYYNPNIESVEFEKRLNEQIRFTSEVYGDTVKVIATEHNTAEFYDKIKGLEDLPEKSSRCKICYELRLEKTAQMCAELGLNEFTTSLPISPHKNFQKITEIGTRLADIYGVSFIPFDFKKKDGFLKTNKIAKDLELYRQNYCGCEFAK